MAFKTNFITFDQGAERVAMAVKKLGIDLSKVVTSRDAGVKTRQEALEVTGLPEGFKKWQLPIVLDRAQLFYSEAGPNIAVPEHSHDEGAGVRLILSGSIIYNGKELSAGDWMYIPKGVKYSFLTGAAGVGQFYCYACCCVPQQQL